MLMHNVDLLDFAGLNSFKVKVLHIKSCTWQQQC